ncbi:MAG: triose-phosphate isomerase, partial [Micavibrio aeruginosavorus]
MKKLIAGNWKMNGSVSEAASLAKSITALDGVDICLCPPFLHMQTVKENIQKGVFLGAQNSSQFKNGAYTGDISAAMAKDIGAEYVILGHSERRQFFGATDKIISDQAVLAHAEGLITIICVGETEVEREQGNAENVVKSQLLGSLPDCATAENTVIAYEPVWAIGTGKTASVDDVKSMHFFIRNVLKERLDKLAAIR